MVKEVSENIKSAFEGKFRILTVIKALLLSYLITIPTFMVFALILSYTTFPEKYMSTAVILTTLISLVIAGSYTTRGLKSKGWLNGAIAGFCYILILYFFSSIVFRDFSIDRHIITMFIIGILTGAIGGIIGINFNSAPKKHKVKSKVKNVHKK